MEQEKRILPLIINLIMGTVFAVGIKLLISVSLMTTAVVPKDWQADALSMTALFYVCLFVSVLIFIAELVAEITVVVKKKMKSTAALVFYIAYVPFFSALFLLHPFF